MKHHEWHEPDEAAGERRYFRAGKFGRRWTVCTMLKSETDWTSLEPVPLAVLEKLRSVLLNKYQRRRVPWEHVTAIDGMVTDAGGESVLAEVER